jgi:hypothetical protein
MSENQKKSENESEHMDHSPTPENTQSTRGDSYPTEKDRQRWHQDLIDTNGEEWVKKHQKLLEAQWEWLKNF